MKRLLFVIAGLGFGYALAYQVHHAASTWRAISRSIDALRWERGEVEAWKHRQGDPGKMLG